jgi:DNA-binding NtrC family response regulator
MLDVGRLARRDRDSATKGMNSVESFPMSHVLIVDDEESICWGLARLLTETGHDVSVASSAEEAFESVARQAPDLVVLDVRLPGMDGLSAMRRLTHLAGEIPIVVITAFGNLEVAVTAMQNGAFDYLAKPFDLEQAAAAIDRALAQGRPAEALSASEPAAGEQGLLGKSAAMQEVFKRIALVAPTDASVLITGESGTGKELVARAIHRHSARAQMPFLPIHLASLSPTLVESELFGHMRGAFTGADSSRQGLLELADGATVFFDEAGDIPAGVQVKLLRVLEQHEVTPVGSAQARATAFRVIAATNRDLQGEQGESALRRDLYFRLAAFEIALPPLRDRVEDIPLLAEHFLRRAHAEGQSVARCSTEAMDELCRRRWPGNVRQLRHAVEHGALLARGGPIAVEHLPKPTDAPSERSPADQIDAATRDWARRRLAEGGLHGRIYQTFLAQVEPALFETVLHSTADNRAAAADVLGIHRATLRKKLSGNSEEP